MNSKLFTIACLLLTAGAIAQSNDHTLFFKQPATIYQEALPLGNGRLGAMVYGSTTIEKIVLNENTLWSGGVQDADNADAWQYLPQIQQLLLQGNNKAAQELLQRYFICKGPGGSQGSDGAFGCYQTMGELGINWLDTLGKVQGYKRTLNLEKGLVQTTWQRGEVNYEEDVFVSKPAQVLVIRLVASGKGHVNFSTMLHRDEHGVVKARNGRLVLNGQLPNAGGPGMRFAAALQVIPKGGAARVTDQGIAVNGADECLLIWSAATDYNRVEPGVRGADPDPVVKETMDKAAERSYSQLLTSSVANYLQMYDRNSFTLGGASDSKLVSGTEVGMLSTPERLIRYAEHGADPGLPVLYYNYGRYLLISSSQPGGLPANLQGLWAPEYHTPWNGDYHININLQMNYWLAEPTGLSDLATPLHEYIASLTTPGGKTAQAYYKAPGWVAHVICNPWGFTSPGEGAGWGSTLTGGAWLCEHLWEHYRFTGDTAFLRKYYPVLKGAAQFLAAILIEEPKHHWLVTAPSNSPENTYIMPNGFQGQTCMGPTMDMQICRELFGSCIQAASILQQDGAFAQHLDSVRKRLAPLQIGAAGDINEWLDDWKDAEPQHRHTSQLYGLFPYDEIGPASTPFMAAAARETLRQRGDEGTGWSKAWKINFWARLGDGDHALVLLHQLLKPVNPATGLNYGSGGTYPNLFCAHPPFQIDGNFGGTSGITEMLLQSQGDSNIIRLLPALPADADWQIGAVKGMHARGAFVVSYNWEKGMLVKGILQSLEGHVCSLFLPAQMRLTDAKGKVIATTADVSKVVTFETRKGWRYSIELAKRK